MQGWLEVQCIKLVFDGLLFPISSVRGGRTKRKVP